LKKKRKKRKKTYVVSQTT